jgi:signal transduction histidine kinase
LYKLNQPFSPIDDDEEPGYIKLSLAAGETGEILVYLKPVKREWISIGPKMISSDFLKNYQLANLEDTGQIKVVGYVLSGLLLMMMLFMLTNYIVNRRPEFLFNAIYSFFVFVLIFLNSYLYRTTTDFANFFYGYFDFFLFVSGVIFYIFFTRSFLNTKINYQKIDKVLRLGLILMFLMLATFTYLNYFTQNFTIQMWIAFSMRVVMLVIGLCFIIMAFRQRNRLLNYLALGNTAMVIFGAISFSLIRVKLGGNAFYKFPEFYYYVGTVLELMFFLMGLTYKNRNELIEKTKEQEALKLEAEKAGYETQIAVIKAQQEERNRISADMHDDLGAGMTTIRLYSELAKNKLGDTPIPEIEKISSSANELLNKMNAIIWSMSSSNDSLGNMVAYIRSYAQEYFDGSGINCRISIPDNLPNIEVAGKIRRNIFLVVKEALNNAMKHAKATEVTITLEKVADGLSLYIQDNGVGINFDQLRQFSNGLINMKQRMKDVDVDFTIENKNGTLITLHRKLDFSRASSSVQ